MGGANIPTNTQKTKMIGNGGTNEPTDQPPKYQNDRIDRKIILCPVAPISKPI